MAAPSHAREQIVDLVGSVNGSNRNFTVSPAYITGTIKVIVNGVVYADDDDYFGWTEVSDTEIQMTTAPTTGWILQAFFTEKIAVGSPFHPAGSYP